MGFDEIAMKFTKNKTDGILPTDGILENIIYVVKMASSSPPSFEVNIKTCLSCHHL